MRVLAWPHPRASAAATSRAPRAGRRRTARRSGRSASAPRRSARSWPPRARRSRRRRAAPGGRGRRLAEDDRDHRDVHRVAQVAVDAADHELLGRRDRRRRAEALDREADHRVGEEAEPGGEQRHAGELQDERGVSALPAAGQPVGTRPPIRPGCKTTKIRLPTAAPSLVTAPAYARPRAALRGEEEVQPACRLQALSGGRQTCVIGCQLDMLEAGHGVRQDRRVVGEMRAQVDQCRPRAPASSATRAASAPVASCSG